MKRYLKTLGLALGAMLALGALFAAGASAEGERFHSTEKNVIVTGEGGPSRFRIGKESTTTGLTIKCETSTYEGTVEGKEFDSVTGTWTTDEVTVHPVYHGCEIEGLGESSVTTHGCDYILTSEIHEEVTPNEHVDKHATVEVECTHNYTIEIGAIGCTIEIGGGFKNHPTELEGGEKQSYGDITKDTLTTGVTYANIGEGHNKTITVDSTVDNIPFTAHGFLCGFGGIPTEGHDGFYEDHVIVEGKEDLNGPCGVDETTHELKECEHGKHVGIWWE